MDDDLIQAARSVQANADAAARVLPLVDLTSLSGEETDADIEVLADRAMAKGVAALCVYPEALAEGGGRVANEQVKRASGVD
ncbi:MAG: hypothetical protein ACR2RE_26510, partial [Geminicoccaceae bacterium]